MESTKPLHVCMPLYSDHPDLGSHPGTSRGVNAQKKSLCLKMTLGQEPHGQMDHFGDESLGTDVCERLFGEVYIYD